MRRLETALPSGSALRALDAALAVWTLAWIALGVVVGAQLQGLADLSETVSQVGVAVEDSGEVFGGLPFVGALADQIQEVGRSAQDTAQSSQDNIDALTALLAPTIALLPSLPLLALYIPARLARSGEARAVAEARDRAGDDPAFRELLARASRRICGGIWPRAATRRWRRRSWSGSGWWSESRAERGMLAVAFLVTL
jgi:hypothetical protein